MLTDQELLFKYSNRDRENLNWIGRPELEFTENPLNRGLMFREKPIELKEVKTKTKTGKDRINKFYYWNNKYYQPLNFIINACAAKEHPFNPIEFQVDIESEKLKWFNNSVQIEIKYLLLSKFFNNPIHKGLDRYDRFNLLKFLDINQSMSRSCRDYFYLYNRNGFDNVNNFGRLKPVESSINWLYDLRYTESGLPMATEIAEPDFEEIARQVFIAMNSVDASKSQMRLFCQGSQRMRLSSDNSTIMRQFISINFDNREDIDQELFIEKCVEKLESIKWDHTEDIIVIDDAKIVYKSKIELKDRQKKGGEAHAQMLSSQKLFEVLNKLYYLYPEIQDNVYSNEQFYKGGASRKNLIAWRKYKLVTYIKNSPLNYINLNNLQDNLKQNEERKIKKNTKERFIDENDIAFKEYDDLPF